MSCIFEASLCQDTNIFQVNTDFFQKKSQQSLTIRKIADQIYRNRSSETGTLDNETYNVFEPYEDEPLAGEIDATEDQETNEEIDIDGLTPFVLEQRYGKSV